MTAAAVALRGYVLGIRFETSERLRTGDSFEFKKKENRKNKIEERNIFLSRDSCSCRATERSERQPIGDSFDLKNRKIEKLKIEERNIFLSCDCTAAVALRNTRKRLRT